MCQGDSGEDRCEKSADVDWFVGGAVGSGNSASTGCSGDVAGNTACGTTGHSPGTAAHEGRWRAERKAVRYRPARRGTDHDHDVTGWRGAEVHDGGHGCELRGQGGPGW